MIKYIRAWFNYTTNCFARKNQLKMKIDLPVTALIDMIEAKYNEIMSSEMLQILLQVSRDHEMFIWLCMTSDNKKC